MHHESSKHIDLKFYFIREHMKINEVELIHAETQDQVVDIFTKPLEVKLFTKFKTLLGMMDERKIKLRGTVELKLNLAKDDIYLIFS